MTIVESDSEIAEFVRQQNVGSVCESTEPEAIAQAILSEYQTWKQNPYDRKKIRAIADAEFGQRVILKKWTELLSQLNK